jgi:signal transduction histidine kinase
VAATREAALRDLLTHLCGPNGAQPEQLPPDREAALEEEHASLRRVAALTAGGASSAEVFGAVAHEVAAVMHLPMVLMGRYDDDGATMTVIGTWSDRTWGDRPHRFQPGTRWPLDGPSLAAEVLRTGRSARLEDYADLPGSVAAGSRESGLGRVAAAAIMVDGRVWGLMAAASPTEPFPDDIEERLVDFTALVAAAISNSQAHEDLRLLADEQAALRRVATLVAEGVTPAEVFTAVAREVGLVLRLALVAMYRYEPDGTATAIGSSGEHPFQPGTNWPLDGPTLASLVRSTGRPARIEDYADVPGTLGEAANRAGFTSGVGAPIVVDGEVWGVVAACSDQREPVCAGAEERLSQFTALVATAISNSQAREDLSRLVGEQAALRRLATLVARGAEPRVVFDAVCEETRRVLGASGVDLSQFTSDGFEDRDSVRARVRATAAPARVDGDERSEVGAPVVVEGQVWGALVVASDGPDAWAAGTEQRLASFAELVATAVSNAAARSELVASRGRIVEAADEQRRRVVRDLHDGAQSRLIHTVMALERARTHDQVAPEVRSAVEEGLMHARLAIGELRELAHGIHPAILTHGGLAAAVEVLADNTPLPVQLGIAEERYPTPVESAAYFVAAEALTNVVKYARASTARVSATRTAAGLHLVVEDDGVGGAERAMGGGLAGLGDRLAALDGVLGIDSPPGGGTRISADIPLQALR